MHIFNCKIPWGYLSDKVPFLRRFCGMGRPGARSSDMGEVCLWLRGKGRKMVYGKIQKGALSNE